MKISTKGRYALRTMIDLAVNDNGSPHSFKRYCRSPRYQLKIHGANYRSSHKS